MSKTNYDWIDPNLMDSHQQRKRERIRAIGDLIEKRRRVDYKRFLAEMQYHGIRKKVAREYLDVLRDLGMIRFSDGYVVWNGENTRTKAA